MVQAVHGRCWRCCDATRPDRDVDSESDGADKFRFEQVCFRELTRRFHSSQRGFRGDLHVVSWRTDGRLFQQSNGFLGAE